MRTPQTSGWNPHRYPLEGALGERFPFIFLRPCTQCQRDLTPVFRGITNYAASDASARPGFGEVGFTPRNLLRVDRVLDAALAAFGGDPRRIILTSTSYGGRGLYEYAARRPGVV